MPEHSVEPGLDPICGMYVEDKEAATTFLYLGHVYAFCSEECYEIFVRAPESIVASLAHDPAGHYGFLCSRQREQQRT